MSTFHPTREIQIALDESRYVRTVTDGTNYGIEFFNGEEHTRAQLSPEAMQAVVNGFQALAAGRGEPIKYEWRVVKSPPLTLSRGPVS